MVENDWEKQVEELIVKGNALDRANKIKESIKTYMKGYALIPEPKLESQYSKILLTSIGELYFLDDMYEDAFDYFSEAIKSKGGLGSAHIHLRLGQLRYERGEIDRAADEFMRVYMGSGDVYFRNIDPKYFEVIKPHIKS